MSLAAPSIADLEPELSWRIGPEGGFEGGQQLRLPQLELLRPNGAIDLQLEHVAAQTQGPTMGRDLRTDCLLPNAPDLMRPSYTIQPKISEHLSDDLTQRGRCALASPRAAAHRPEAPGGLR